MKSLNVPIRPGDPAEHQRNPHQTFLLLLSVLASFPLLRGQAGSPVLERELSDSTVVLWGLTLLGGSVLALVGQFWRGERFIAFALERFGLACVGIAAAVYAVMVFSQAPSAADISYPLSIQVAYAGACAWRCGQITHRLRWLRAEAEAEAENPEEL